MVHFFSYPNSSWEYTPSSDPSWFVLWSYGPEAAVTFEGAGGSLSVAVTKSALSTLPVSVDFEGTGGSLSVAVTKSSLSTLPVSVDFEGAGGSLSVAVTKSSLSTLPVSVDFEGTGGSLSVAVTKSSLSTLPVSVDFEGTGGSLSVAVTKSSLSTLPVSVDFEGTGGSLSVAVTKSSLSTLPVSVDFEGAGGSLSVAVTKSSLSTLPVSVDFEGAGGSLSVAVTVVIPLALSNWSVPAGRTEIFAGLIEVQVSGEERYRPGSNIGSLLDGNLVLASDLTCNRIRIRFGTTVVFNRTGTGFFADYLESGGEYRTGRLHLQTLDDAEDIDVTEISDNDIGEGFLSVRNTVDSAFVNLFAGLATGNRVIVAFTDEAPSLQQAAVTFEGTGGSLSVAVTKSSLSTLPVSVDFEGTGGSLSVAVTKSSLSTLPVSVDFEGAGGSLSVAVTKSSLSTLPVSVDFEGAGGSLSVAVTVVIPLALSNWSVPAGRTEIFAGLIEVQVSGEERYRPGSNIGSLLDGNLVLASDLTCNRIRIRFGTTVVFNRTGTGFFADYLESGGEYRTGRLHLQTLDDAEDIDVTEISDNDIGEGFLSVRNTVDSAFVNLFAGLATGNRVIVAFTDEAPSLQQAAVTFEGTGGSLSVAVTKSSLSTLPVSVDFEGTGGSLSVAVTKSSLSTLPVSVDFEGAGGSLSVAVTKSSLSTLPVSVDFEGAGGSLSVAVTVVIPLALSNWSVPAGRTEIFAGLIEVQVSGEERYRPGSNIGSLLDGNLVLASDLTCNRIRIRFGTTVVFNRTGTGFFADYLESGGEYRTGRLHLQTLDDAEDIDVTEISDNDIGEGFLSVRNTVDSAFVNLFAGLATGNRVIVAFTDEAPSLQQAAVTFEGTGGSLSVAVTKSSLSTLPVSVDFEGTGGSLSVAVTKSSLSTLPVSVDFEGAGGSLSVAVTKSSLSTLPVSVDFEGAGGSLSVAVTKSSLSTLPVSVDFEGTGGSLSVAVTKSALSTLPVSVDFEGTGGSLSVAVTKSALSTLPVSVDFEGTGGSLSVAVTVVIPSVIVPVGRIYSVDAADRQFWHLDHEAAANSTLVGTLPDTITGIIQGMTQHGEEMLAIESRISADARLWLIDVITPGATLIDVVPGLERPRGLTSHNDELWCIEDEGSDVPSMWRIDRSNLSNSVRVPHSGFVQLDPEPDLTDPGCLASDGTRMLVLSTVPSQGVYTIRVSGTSSYTFNHRGTLNSQLNFQGISFYNGDVYAVDRNLDQFFRLTQYLTEPIQGINLGQLPSGISDLRCLAGYDFIPGQGIAQSLEVNSNIDFSPFTLANFFSEGLDILLIGLLKVSHSSIYLFRGPQSGGTDVPLEGLLQFDPPGSNPSMLSQITYDTNYRFQGITTLYIYTENSDWNLREAFNPDTGYANDVTFWIQTPYSLVNFSISNRTFLNDHPSVFQFQNLSTDVTAILNEITAGSRCIFAITRPVVGYSVSGMADSLTAKASIASITPPAEVPVAGQAQSFEALVFIEFPAVGQAQSFEAVASIASITPPAEVPAVGQAQSFEALASIASITPPAEVPAVGQAQSFEAVASIRFAGAGQAQSFEAVASIAFPAVGQAQSLEALASIDFTAAGQAQSLEALASIDFTAAGQAQSFEALASIASITPPAEVPAAGQAQSFEALASIASITPPAEVPAVGQAQSFESIVSLTPPSGRASSIPAGQITRRKFKILEQLAP